MPQVTSSESFHLLSLQLYGKKQFLGSFQDEEEAARAVDRSIRVTGAEKATQLRMLNFLETHDYFDELWDEERSAPFRLQVLAGAC